MSGWTCGDCGTRYPDEVWYCTNDALDSISLAGYTANAPIYTALVAEWNFNPIGDAAYRKAMRNHPVLVKRYAR